MRQLLTLIGLLGMMGLLLGGCASMQPLSSYARTGDTVVISLGGTKQNALLPMLKKANITISITDNSSNTYLVKLRSLIRLYSDPTSNHEYDNLKGGENTTTASFVDPHQGVWLAFIDLIDPVTDTPPPLVVGPASLSVNSTDIQNWFDIFGSGIFWVNGDLSNIPIEILAGTGGPNPLNYMQPITYSPILSLEAAEQIEVRVSGIPDVEIGSGTFVIQYSNESFNFTPRVSTTSPDPNVQMVWNNEDQGNGTSLLNVMVINSHGFSTNNDRNSIAYIGANGGKSLLSSLYFNVFWNGDNGVDDSNWQSHIDLISAEYHDLSGYPMPELSATIQKIN